MIVFLVSFLALLTIVMSCNSSLTIIQPFLIKVCHFVMYYETNSSLIILCGLLASFSTLYFMVTSRRKQVYLVDFACYKPDPTCKCTKERFLEAIGSTGKFQNESLDFQRKIMERSGLGEETYMAESVLEIPSKVSLAEARKETESVIFGAIDELLLKTKVKAEDIGIVVTNCSVFNPTPSLSAMVVKHYRLRHDIMSYNLSGMGCSAGLIAIDLAQQLLQVHSNSSALVVSTENINGGSYFGNNRSMLVSNCLFRVGGAAILLSNISSNYYHSKYNLKHIVRTHKGSVDHCYNSITQEEDEKGVTGIALSKDIMSSAGEALKANISTLGTYVLPLMEQLKFIANLAAKQFLLKRVKSYTPNFELAFDHFCIHTGGKAVQDGVQKVLELSDWHMEPSRMTLFRYGNTSSSSVWYELAYCEAKGRIKKGDRIWQIGFGSGFKCNSVVLCALQTINPANEKKNPWKDEIDDFPVDILKRSMQ